MKYRDKSRVPGRKIELNDIMRHVSEHTGIIEERIRNKGRKQNVVYARHLYSFLALTLTKEREKSIASFISPGYRHSNVIHSSTTMTNLYHMYRHVRHDVDILTDLLCQGS